MHKNLGSPYMSTIIADPWGTPGMRAPSGSKFFLFYAVFSKKIAKNRLADPLWKLAPPMKILDPPLTIDGKNHSSTHK